MNHWQEIKTMRKNSGFTLVELIIAIVIIFILVAISVPIFLSWLPDYRLRSAADDLYSNLQYAKMEAIKNNVNWAVAFDFSANSYTVRSNHTGVGTGTIVKTVDLSSYGSGVGYGKGNATESVPGGTIPADFVSYTSDEAVFNTRGMVNNLGYVYLSNNAGASRAGGTPALAGVVVLRRWTGSDWE